MKPEDPSLAETLAILARTVMEVQISSVSGLSALTPSQSAYLEAVARLERPTLSDLARELRVSKPSATLAIEHLEREGYIHKVRASNDRRAIHLHLTEQGQHLADKQAQVRQFIAGALTASLDEGEQEQLAFLLRKIVQSLS